MKGFECEEVMFYFSKHEKLIKKKHHKNEKITCFKFDCDPTVVSRLKIDGMNFGSPINIGGVR